MVLNATVEAIASLSSNKIARMISNRVLFFPEPGASPGKKANTGGLPRSQRLLYPHLCRSVVPSGSDCPDTPSDHEGPAGFSWTAAAALHETAIAAASSNDNSNGNDSSGDTNINSTNFAGFRKVVVVTSAEVEMR